MKFLLILLFCLMPILNGVSFFSEKEEDAGERWAVQIMEGLPKNSVLYVTFDWDTFPYAYLIYAKKFRIDLQLIDGGWDTVTVPALQITEWPTLSYEERARRNLSRIKKLLEEGRSIFGFYFPPKVVPDGWEAKPNGFHYQLVEKGKHVVSRKNEAEQFFHQILPLKTRKEGWGNQTKAFVAYQLALPFWDHTMESGDGFEETISELLRLAPISPYLYAKAGHLLFVHNPEDTQTAGNLFLQSILHSREIWLAELPEAWLFLAGLDFNEGNYQRGLERVRRAVALDPSLQSLVPTDHLLQSQ